MLGEVEGPLDQAEIDVLDPAVAFEAGPLQVSHRVRFDRLNAIHTGYQFVADDVAVGPLAFERDVVIGQISSKISRSRVFSRQVIVAPGIPVRFAPKSRISYEPRRVLADNAMASALG